jgi:CRISPR-associated endoribonuclease Cas6
MKEALEKLTFALFEFVLVPERTIVFPPFKGNVFRGALGKTLRYLTCAFRDKDCSDCLIRDKCIYSRMFESIHSGGESILKNIERAPHPFVLYVPDKYHLEYPENSKVHFFLTLVGEAVDYISYFILAFEEMGRNGIGKQRTPFAVERVMCGGKNIYDTVEKKVTKDFPLLTGKDLMGEQARVNEIKIELETPIRLKFGGKFRKHITFEMIIRNLLRRIQLLAALYCGGPARVDFVDLIEKSKGIKVMDSAVHWVRQTRFSYRQEKSVGVGGVCGSISFEGDIGPFISFLRLAEYLHVGKSTAFGLGRIKINKSFCGGPGGSFFKKRPLAAGGEKI